MRAESHNSPGGVTMQDAIHRIRQFRDERDWMQFHDAKNLTISIALEAAELMEHFQWTTSEQVVRRAVARKEEIALEMADIAIYLLELADNLEVDLPKAIHAKLDLNALKYPVDKAKGVSHKYTEL